MMPTIHVSTCPAPRLSSFLSPVSFKHNALRTVHFPSVASRFPRTPSTVFASYGSMVSRNSMTHCTVLLRCGLSEGTNELKRALGCFLLDTYYVNGEERETEEREPQSAQCRRCEGILHDPSQTILCGSHRLPSLPHDGIPVNELQYLLYLDPRYSTTVEVIMVQRDREKGLR